MTDKKWYQSNWFIVLSLFIFLPLGLYLMWNQSSFTLKRKIAITVIASSIFVTCLNLFAVSNYNNFNNNNEAASESSTNNNNETSENDNSDLENYSLDYDEENYKEENNEKSSFTDISSYENDSSYNDSSLETSSDPSITTGTREQEAALKSAESYSMIFHMSKRGIYNQLTSEYGDKFPPDAAQYAIDHLDVDYNENALQNAMTYADTFNMSNAEIYNQLISDYGEKFTAEEAQYAIDHLEK